MSDQYAREILRRNVAQICQTIGWNGINSTPLDILVHVLERYIQTLGTQTGRYAEQFNRTDPNLDDLGLVFRDLNVQLPELADYVRSVPPVPPPVQVDKFPKPKESNLNFLKPGSHEVVTRPMHVHEHLPPMYPEKERDTPAVAGTVEIKQNGIENAETSNATCTSPEISVDSPEKPNDIFKRPTDPVSLPNSKRPRLRLEEEERTREISSVMMTMSGFLSPAREGKLPEARAPNIISEKHYDKHPSSHSSTGAPKAPVIEKSDKKAKKNKLLNGKIMKSKRKDKSHKGESSKSKDSSKLNKSPGYVRKGKDVPHPHKHSATDSAPKASTSRPTLPPVSVPETTRQPIRQEPTDQVKTVSKSPLSLEDAIPVPKRIPISKSPLVSAAPVNKNTGTNPLISESQIKKEIIDEEEKLASQPDKSKINIFKRISNKSKEDKSATEVAPEKSHSDTLISKVLKPTHTITAFEAAQLKSGNAAVNNNDTSAADLSKEMDLRAHEVINIDDDSLDVSSAMHSKSLHADPHTGVGKSLTLPHPKDVASVSPKVKKEKKHKVKKDKAAKLEAKLLKRQKQQLDAAQGMDKLDGKKTKASKSGRPKKQKLPPITPPMFPFFAGMPQGRNLKPGPGLVPNPHLIPNSDFLAGLANNPALRGLPPSSLLTNPFAMGVGGPGLIPGPGLFPGSGLPNPLMAMGNFPPSARSSTSMKIPTMLRRPSLEVIPVDNDDDNMHKPQTSGREKDRHDKRKSPTIPNILQKHKSKSHKEHKSLYKMPPVQPDITIQLNPPKAEHSKREPPPDTAPPPTTEVIPQVKLEIPPVPTTSKSPEGSQGKHAESTEKKKEKSHKKDKKNKDGLKIKKKKDKKDKNKEKSEKKRDKVELKDKIKKEKREKKEKSTDGLVPKLTLKLSSSNSNSPMPPSSPEVFKLNIKPVVKKEDVEETSSQKEDLASRGHSRSPELAQISALVTRPHKQKHSKHNNTAEAEMPSSPPPAAPSPPRKNRPPSSHSKYKRILFKPLSKKGHFEDDMASMSEEAAPTASASTEKPTGPLPTPYYLDEHGNKIWVCPACGRPDNGSPMIGCDGCDGWYHWVCVGITEEPGATEDWFCKSCLAKRTAMVLAGVTSSGKKRGRKPKGDKAQDCH